MAIVQPRARGRTGTYLNLLRLSCDAIEAPPLSLPIMRKIVTLVYYHPMARFFSAIEDAWKQREPDAQFLHLAVFPSAWMYFAMKGRRSIPLSWCALLGSYAEHHVPDDVLDAAIRFHSADPNLTPRQHARLRRQARNTLGLCREVIQDFDPDVAIISGDTRLPAEALMCALKGTKTVSWYFEQGPYKTTVLDQKGVNANCSFREALAQLEPSNDPFDPAPCFPRYANKWYSSVDRLALTQSKITGLIPPDLLPYRMRKCPRDRYVQLTSRAMPATPREKVVLLAMQVPEDANNVYHNPLGLTDVGLLTMLLDCGDTSWSIVVREHPLYRRRYSSAFYRTLADSKHVCLSAASLADDLQRTASTVTVNSMTGLDAFARGHRVVVLGDSFYDHLPGILRARSLEEMRSHLLAPFDTSSREPAARLLGPLVKRYFHKGHFHDRDLGFTESIVDRVIASLPAVA